MQDNTKKGSSRTLVLLVALPGLLAACQSSTGNKSAHASHEGQAQVTFLKGTASYSSQGGSWEMLGVGTSLWRGDAIRTGDDSEIDLRFYATGPVARLKASSELKFLRMERWGWTTGSRSMTQLELVKGRMLVDDQRLPPGSKFEIRTAEGIVYSKGSEEKPGQHGKSSIGR